MKILISILFILSQTGHLIGQISEIEKCGLDDAPWLKSYEVNYFNQVFEEKRGTFDFSGKVIAFYKGSSGTTKSRKSDYFKGLKQANNGDQSIHAWQAGGTQLLILTKEEKELSGGYDAILVSWSKLPKAGKARTRLVKRLNHTLTKKT